MRNGFNFLEEANKEYERNKWEKRKKKRDCKGENIKDCQLPPPEKTISYISETVDKFLNRF